MLYTANPDPQLTAIRDALRTLGADVATRPLDSRYDEILDAVAQSDTIVYWRRRTTG